VKEGVAVDKLLLNTTSIYNCPVETSVADTLKYSEGLLTLQNARSKNMLSPVALITPVGPAGAGYALFVIPGCLSYNI